MNEPRRLRHGQSALMTELLDAGRCEEPSPELIARALRSAAFGVGAGLTVIHTAAASTVGTSGVSAGSAGSASVGAGAASTGLAGGAATNVSAGAALAKSGLAGVALAKWVGAGVLGLSVATAAPKVLHWAEPGPSSALTTHTAQPLGASVPERRAPSASRELPLTPAPPVAPEPPVTLEPPVTPAPVAALASERAVAPEPRVASPTRRPARASLDVVPMPPRSGAPRVDAHTLGLELRALDSARAALQRGDAARALHELERYELDAPEQQLRLEVAMLRMNAYAALGDVTRARSLASEIIAQPVSPRHAAHARDILNGAGAHR